MEQQDQVQGLAQPSGVDTENLEWKGEEAPYEFRNGLYYTPSIDSAFLSLETLRKAWKAKVRADKLAEARTAIRPPVGRAAKTVSQKEFKRKQQKALEDFKEWQQAE